MSPKGTYLLLALSSLLNGCHRPPAAPRNPQPVETEVVSASLPINDEVTYTAVALPNREVDLAVKAGGYVVWLADRRSSNGGLRPIDVGDLVRAREPLLRVSAPESRSRLKQANSMVEGALAAHTDAEVQLVEAEQDVTRASTDWTRAQRMYSQDALTKPDYEAARGKNDAAIAHQASARAGRDAQRSRISSAKAQRDEAGALLAQAQVRSPFDGVVTGRKFLTGSLIADGATAFSVAELKQVKVAFSVPDIQVGLFHPGDRLSVRVDALRSPPITGIVTIVAAAADPQTSTFRIELCLPNVGQQLRPGMVVTVLMISQRRPASPLVTVPVSALVHQPGMGQTYSIFALVQRGDQSFAHLQPVQPGEISGDAVSIKWGLIAGTKVIVKGGMDLVEGAAVIETPLTMQGERP